MLIIGNILSFGAAMFTAASCCVKDRRKVFLFQFMECAVLAAASFFFGAYAGITALVLSGARNLLIAANRFDRRLMWVFLALIAAAGLLTNNRGLVGLMPVAATLEYTVCCHYVTGVKATRVSILVNALIWMVYSALILDISTAISNLIVSLVDIAAILKLAREERQEAAAEQ